MVKKSESKLKMFHINDCTQGRDWFVLAETGKKAITKLIEAQVGSEIDDLEVSDDDCDIIEVSSGLRVECYN